MTTVMLTCFQFQQLDLIRQGGQVAGGGGVEVKTGAGQEWQEGRGDRPQENLKQTEVPNLMPGTLK